MEERADESPPPVERVERIEVIERTPAAGPARSATPMWVWLLPLVIIVLALVWYILARGNPVSPGEVIEESVTVLRLAAPWRSGPA